MNTYGTDFFSKCPKSGDEYAGRHVLSDFWDVGRMDNLQFIQRSIEESAHAAGATILHSYYHPFGEGMGVSGVTVLSESHISIHTWPERSFASLDIFMCGDCDPDIALDHLSKVFQPARIERTLVRRGIVKQISRIAA